MSGREVLLLKDVAHLYTGGDPKKLQSDWDDPNAKHEWGPGRNPSSKNIYKLSRNIRLFVYLKHPGLYPKHLTNPMEDITAMLKEEKRLGFMLNEQDSPIYWFLHLQLVLGVLHLSKRYNVSAELMGLAREWLWTFLSSCELASTKGQVYLCGQRGWDDAPPSHDILESIVFGYPYPKFASKYDYGKFLIATESTVREEVRSAPHHFSWPKMVPVHYITFERGELTYVEQSINGNTPMRAVALRVDASLAPSLVNNVSAMYWEIDSKTGTACGWLPGKVARYRGRGKSDQAVVLFDKTKKHLSYTANFYDDAVIGLEGLGRTVKHQVWDKSGLRNADAPAPVAPVNPLTPPNPAPPAPVDIYYPNMKPQKTWWEKLLDWL